MNKLITTEPGGHPFMLEDLGFIQNAYTEAFAVMIRGLSESSNPGYRLIGCDLIYNPFTSTVWVNSGYVALKANTAQIYPVETHDTGVASLSGPFYWSVEEFSVAPSPVAYKAIGPAKHVHIRNKLKLSGTPSGLPSYANTPMWLDTLKNTLWKPTAQIALINNWAYGMNPVPNASLSVEGKRVFMCGDIRYMGTTAPTVNAPFYVLPPHLRPADNHMFICLVSLPFNETNKYVSTLHMGTVPRQTWVRIQKDGNCYADPINVAYTSQSQNFSIVLDGVSWLLP